MDAELIEQLAEQATAEHGDYAGRAIRDLCGYLGNPHWMVLAIPVSIAEGINSNFATADTLRDLIGRMAAMLDAAEKAGYDIERPWENDGPAQS